MLNLDAGMVVAYSDMPLQHLPQTKEDHKKHQSG
jgi:hypothetical protein